jgi:hypothetical protein
MEMMKMTEDLVIAVADSVYKVQHQNCQCSLHQAGFGQVLAYFRAEKSQTVVPELVSVQG